MRLSNADNCPEVGKFKPGLFSEISCETTATSSHSYNCSKEQLDILSLINIALARV